MSDALDGLEAVDWNGIGAAYGSAAEVPDLLSTAYSGDGDVWFELWGMLCHQGTVYDASPIAVPFLAQLAIRREGDEWGRSQAGFLLASIAAAQSYVLADEPRRMLYPDWSREPGEPIPSRDLARESNAAVAAHAASLADALNGAPPPVRAGILAALAAVGPLLPESARKALAPLVRDPDVRVGAAAGIALDLAAGTITAERVRAVAQIDEEASDYLEAISDWPEPIRAVELVRELCTHVASDE